MNKKINDVPGALKRVIQSVEEQVENKKQFIVADIVQGGMAILRWNNKTGTVEVVNPVDVTIKNVQ